MMVAVHPDKGEEHYAQLRAWISDYHIGGAVFVGGTPERQVPLTNAFQECAKTPLLIGIDSGYDLPAYCDSSVFPLSQLMLRAVNEKQLVYETGKQTAQQWRAMGIHLHFAPLTDLHKHLDRPLNNRPSAGDSTPIATDWNAAYLKALQDQHLLVCNKYFHTSPSTGSEVDTAASDGQHPRDTLQQQALQTLIDQQLAGVAVVYSPLLHATANPLANSFPELAHMLLRTLGFEGLVFTELTSAHHLNRSAEGRQERAAVRDRRENSDERVSTVDKRIILYDSLGKRLESAMPERTLTAEEIAFRAIVAGSDVCLFPEDVPKTVDRIKMALNRGEMSVQELDKRCLNVLKAKQWAGLDRYTAADPRQHKAPSRMVEAAVLHRKIARQSLTLLKNEDVLPLRFSNRQKTVYLNIGGAPANAFYKRLTTYTSLPQVRVSPSLTAEQETALIARLKPFEKVIIGLHLSTTSLEHQGELPASCARIHRQLSELHEVVTVLFGTPHAVRQLGELEDTEGLLVAYQDHHNTQEAAAQIVMGGMVPKGKLPVAVSERFPVGHGATYPQKTRLAHVLPEEIGIDREALSRIDSIALDGIHKGAYPGCQIVAIKDGNVCYNKAFGHHTYARKRAVNKEDVYDLASITKIAATTISLIKLQQEGTIDIDRTLGDYLPEVVNGTPYQTMVLRRMLAHQAGLQPWIPFYVQTLKEGVLDTAVYATDSSALFNCKVAEDIYISCDYEEELLQFILEKPLRKKTYKYSDLGYYFIKAIVEKKTRMPLEEYVRRQFYSPMGLSRMMYLPLRQLERSRIVPTEQDTVFRHQLVWGTVHDPGAAMQGGVGGHAGLFSNALDLGTLIYMLTNKGNYGGRHYLDQATIDDFTRCQYPPDNRRGAGFDKPVRTLDGGPTCNKVTLSSFGHSGFTGTITWADPEAGIVYVFLSNRVHPNAGNWKIVSEGIRTAIQEAIYLAAE